MIFSDLKKKKMSFRSRSRTTQPVVRHRSLSSSRVPTSSTSNSYLSNHLSNPSTYTSNRPLTVSYSVTPNTYNSRENLYSPTKRSTFFTSGNNTASNTSPYSHRKESYSSSYKSPYADRYVSPYSTYENGITTAGLNLSAYTSGNSYKANSTFKPSSSSNNYNNPVNNYGNSTKSYKRDYTTPPRNISLLSSKRFSSSNNSLNTYVPTSSTINTSIGRSQSFKNDDHNSRRNKNVSKINRSNSISSEKSEGYEVRFSFGLDSYRIFLYLYCANCLCAIVLFRL